MKRIRILKTFPFFTKSTREQHFHVLDFLVLSYPRIKFESFFKNFYKKRFLGI